MKKRKNKVFAFLSLFIVLSLSYSLPFENIESFNQDEMEIYLKNAEVISIERDLELGRTNFWTITLNDGNKERKAIFKHVNRPRPLLLPDCYKYEIAAYQLNKILGLNVVPPVVERKINHYTGSVQLLIEKAMTDRDRKMRGIEPENPDEFKNDLDIINIFEILVYDQCRDSSDTLIQLDKWKVWRVDFSEAFSPSTLIFNDCQIQRCSRILYNRILALANNQLEKELDTYLNKNEINALLERKHMIIKTIKHLIKQKGEDQVLF